MKNSPVHSLHFTLLNRVKLIAYYQYNLVIFIISILLLSGCDYLFPPLRVDKITIEEAFNFLNKHKGDTKVVLLDIRTKTEYDSLNIDNSINIDFSKPDFPDITEKLDKEKRYIIIDDNGKKAAMAFELMKEQRFSKVHYMIGGINEWVKNNLPVTKRK